MVKYHHGKLWKTHSRQAQQSRDHKFHGIEGIGRGSERTRTKSLPPR